MVDLEVKEKRDAFEQKMIQMGIETLELIELLKGQAYDAIISRKLLMNNVGQIEFYLLEGFGLASRDGVGEDSDPYCVIKIGNVTFNERDNYTPDCSNPKFNKRYEFKGEFPGCYPLVVEVFDHDFLFGDDLIGKTIMDLDERFFNQDW